MEARESSSDLWVSAATVPVVLAEVEWCGSICCIHIAGEREALKGPGVRTSRSRSRSLQRECATRHVDKHKITLQQIHLAQCHLA